VSKTGSELRRPDANVAKKREIESKEYTMNRLLNRRRDLFANDATKSRLAVVSRNSPDLERCSTAGIERHIRKAVSE